MAVYEDWGGQGDGDGLFYLKTDGESGCSASASCVRSYAICSNTIAECWEMGDLTLVLRAMAGVELQEIPLFSW